MRGKIITINLFAGLCSFVLCIYFIIKSVSLLYPPTLSAYDRIFIIIFLLGESYFLLLSFGFMLSIITVSKKNDFFSRPKKIDKIPSVAVVVAARHEPKNILENTFSTLKALDYEDINIYLLDDSSDSQFIEEADEIGKRYGINIYRREKRHGAKAGIVNDFLKIAKETYVVIFDADQNPMPDFVKTLVPFMEENEKLAFIQTPQFYTNINISPVAKGATIQQAIFYEFICEAKSSRKAMFCCGTNVIFRKNALLEIGGFDEKSITEDFATSIKFHLRGYQSLYYNKVAAFGMAPENLVAYFKQQIRWSAGTIGVFRSIIFNFLRNPFKLKPIQWLEYFLSGIYYFIGWAFFIMIMGPVLYLIFDFPKMYSNHQVYLFPFITYLILNLYVFYFSMTKRNYKFFEIYHGVMLSFLIFPILLKSTVLGLFGKKMTFVVTTKGKNEQMPLVFLWPYIIMILLNIVAFIFGISKVKSNPIGISGNLFWVIWHIFILSNIFYFNKKQINDT